MVELEGCPPSKQPLPAGAPQQQLSDMFQKFALAFKAKTYELFAEEEDSGAAADSDCDVTLLLDSAEEFIPDQKVVVIKPDSVDDRGARLYQALIPSLFVTLASFEAAYLQFQSAHVPEIDRDALEHADRLIVSILQKLAEMKNLYRDSRRGRSGVNVGYEFPACSFWEFEVQENQSKLRVLETVVNFLQSQIDAKDEEVSDLRKKLDHIEASTANLTRKLGSKKVTIHSQIEVSLTLPVFEGMLAGVVKSMRHFTKLLIDLMRKAGWGLEEAANSVYSGVDFAKEGHFRYAFLSYISLRMFRNFDKHDFGLPASEIICNENVSKHSKNGEGDNSYLKQLIEHTSDNHMEILRKNPKCDFSRFCEHKYEELIHPTMESSIFSNLDSKEKVLGSWKSLNVFYELLVRMASSIWLLHRLAYSFNPVVEIFQVERGVDFSMVYMEDVTAKFSSTGKTKPKVGFTVVPGFKVSRTVFQSQVYLTHLNCAD